MFRHLFTLLAALSLLILICCAGLWVRSLTQYDMICQDRAGRSYSVEVVSVDGSLVFFRSNYACSSSGVHHEIEAASAPEAESFRFLFSYPKDRWWEWLGFASVREPVGTYSFISTPYWAFAAGFSLLPAIVFINQMRRGYHLGFCPVCGYDLRATPNRCPECGEVPVGAKT